MLNCLHGIPLVDEFQKNLAAFFILLVTRNEYLPTTVSPAAKFKVTFLVIKRKPCNVNLACALKNSWWYVEAVASVGHHHVGLEGSVKLLIGAEKKIKKH